jgi:hypothetical protein
MNPSVAAISPLTRQLANAIGDCCAAQKVQPYDLRQGDFVRWLKDERKLGRDDLRKIQAHFSRVGGFVQLRNAFFVGSPTPGLLEKVEMEGIAKLGRANVTALAHDEIFLSRLQEVMSATLKQAGRLPPFGFSVKPSREKTARVVTQALSDLHFGSRLDPRELPFRYDFEEEARAMASVLVRLCQFKLDYRAETDLIIWLGGDLTRGKIHDRQAGRAGAEQACDAMWLLTQFIRVAAGNFKKVTVYCSTGNHDRDEARSHGTAFEEKWDSRGTTIYYGIKLAVQHLPNVQVFIPRTPYCEWEVFGRRVYATHGDTNLNPGNPSRTVDVGNIYRQMTNINLAEFQAGRKQYEAFMCGHVHQGMHLPLPSGELVINPALIPIDGYTRGIGIANTKFGQVMFESTPEHVVGDLRFTFVDGEVFKDKSLDRVIAPFKDF